MEGVCTWFKERHEHVKIRAIFVLFLYTDKEALHAHHKWANCMD